MMRCWRLSGACGQCTLAYALLVFAGRNVLCMGGGLIGLLLISGLGMQSGAVWRMTLLAPKHGFCRGLRIYIMSQRRVNPLQPEMALGESRYASADGWKTYRPESSSLSTCCLEPSSASRRSSRTGHYPVHTAI